MNKRKNTISIVIPAFNEERYLKACLESIGAQSVKPDEVIVVNNNSTDKTVAIAKAYSFVTLIHEDSQGITFARNAGFDAASKSIIGRIDADTVLPSNWVEHVLNYYDNPKHSRTAWTGGPHFYNVRFPHFVGWMYVLLGIRSNLLFAGTRSLWGSNMAVPREAWQLVQNEVCQRADIHEDLDLALHLQAHGIKTKYDHRLKVNTQMRRVKTNRHELWDYLQWWPRTLRVHQFPTWIIVWFFGAFLLYYTTPLLNLAEKLARLFGRAPLPD